MKLRNHKALLPFLISVFIVSTIGCTNKRPYDDTFKDEHEERPKHLLLNGENSPRVYKDSSNSHVVAVMSGDDWLYVPSTVNITRSTRATIPFYMGEARKVKVVFTKDQLKLLESEEDERFSENILNSKPILSIPISHIDYKCQEDANGKCTQKEGLNEDVSWDKKRRFQVDIAGMANQSINFLPIEFDNLFFPCHTEVGSQFVDYQIDENSVNIQVEKTFKSNLMCATHVESLKDLTFSVKYHHSLVRMSSIVTPGYTPLEYTRNDENNFGFFTERVHRLDEDNSDIVGSERFLFKRWSPNKVINYHLSDNFNKAEFAKIKEATLKAVASINNSLQKAGAKLKINLTDETGKSPGDIRNNMIVLIEDPQASGIIGYGPSASNPATGEILHARTAMFLGTMKKFIKINYEEMLREHLSAKAEMTSTTVKIDPRLLSHPNPLEQIAISDSALQSGLSHLPLIGVPSSSAPDLQRRNDNKAVGDIIASNARLRDHVTNPARFSDLSNNVKEQIEFLTKIHAYPEELFNFSAAFKVEIEKLIKELNEKPWLELSVTEKQRVIDVLLPHVWVPTLVHELGHNLGLRHNFSGSEDKENFYTKEELAQMGIDAEVKYSSVMDYAYRSTNELPAMGKYDIAALRYGYAERVELVDGKLISLSDYRKDPRSVEIKPYGYCTDEHVGANPNCNRFDEGTNLVEIATHYIEAYEQRYKLANTRYKRRNFSLYDDPGYIYGIYRIFMGMRMVFERYENIKNSYSLDDSNPIWDQYDFLKDLKNATHISAGFFLAVLDTPDVLCGIAQKSDLNTVIAVLPIRELSSFAVSCFDTNEIQLNDQYQVIAEAGKSFQSRKSTSNPNPYVDQIDVRGVWADKLIAANMLTAGTLGSSMFDKFTDNYFSIPTIAPAIRVSLDNLIKDEVNGYVLFKNSSGNPVAGGYMNINLQADADALNSHRLLMPLHPTARKMMDLPDSETNFQAELIKILSRNLKENNNKKLNQLLLEELEVFTELPRDGRPISEYEVVDIGNHKFFSLKTNKLASEIINNLKIVKLLGQIDNEVLFEIKEEIKSASEAEQPPTETRTGLELEAKKLGLKILNRYLNAGFKTQNFYESIIIDLANI